MKFCKAVRLSKWLHMNACVYREGEKSSQTALQVTNITGNKIHIFSIVDLYYLEFIRNCMQ